jgi:hypothetical protein
MATDVSSNARRCLIEMIRRMGPRLRGDDSKESRDDSKESRDDRTESANILDVF